MVYKVAAILILYNAMVIAISAMRVFGSNWS